MSSPDRLTRRALLAGMAGLAGLAALAGCGFTPVYGPGGAGGKLRGRVRPRDPATPEDFIFDTRLAERLGPESAAAYALDYTLMLAATAQGVRGDDVTTRFALNGSATYRLTDVTSGTVLAEGRVNAFSSYTAEGTTVATVAAEADARGRLAVMLADQVVTRLLAAPIP